MPGASGAGRESPIGDDDNEEVRQRAGRALILVFRFHTNFNHRINSCNTHSTHASPPAFSFIALQLAYAAREDTT